MFVNETAPHYALHMQSLVRSGDPVLIVGAGVGGLCAAIDLAARGLPVELHERAPQAGGKLHQHEVGGLAVDAGPTVLTLPEVFASLMQDAGARLEERVTLRPLPILARHAWQDGTLFDLPAELEAACAEITRVFGPAEAQGYRRFAAITASIYEAVETPIIASQRPSLLGMLPRLGLRGLWRFSQVDPFRSLWRATGEHLRDPRLRQLFARYATYSGASPFLAPATLGLIAHVERRGVHAVEGGMIRLARALVELAQELGVAIVLDSPVEEVLVEGGRARGLRLGDGTHRWGRAVVLNADANALASGRFGEAARGAVAPIPPARRSLSALTLALRARVEGFALAHHNVCFGRDYEAEFRAIFDEGRLPPDPTVYLCAQDRLHDAHGDPGGPGPAERLFVIINAPAHGDLRPLGAQEVQGCIQAAIEGMGRCGLRLRTDGEPVITRPQDWERRFPATGGALYGEANHSWRHTFQRPGARSRLPGLYLCGGSAHPGAGLPMAALSGRLAAEQLARDLAWTRPFRGTATPGGTSTSSIPARASA